MAKYVVFELDAEPYGLGIEQVKSIETMKPITRVPTSNPYVVGVMNLRGVVIPVISLRKRLRMPEVEYGPETRIIVMMHADGEVGLVVDAAQNVIDIEDSHLQPPVDGSFELLYVQSMTNIGDKVLSVLNLEELLSQTLDESLGAMASGQDPDC